MTLQSLESEAISAFAILVDVSVRSLVFAAAVAAGSLLLRRASATQKLGIWRMVLAVALAMPLVLPVLPGVRIELPFWTIDAAASSAMSTPIAAPVAAELSSTASVADRSSPSWLAMVTIVYAAGLILLLVRIGAGLVTARGFLRRAQPVEDDAAIARVRQLSACAGVSRRPALRESSDALVPLTASVFRPTIVVPRSWREWSSARLDAVLTHELAHIARRDLLYQHVSLVYRAITWFSPLGWWLHRQLTELAEQASDEAVLSSGADSADYASTLVEFVAVAQGASHRARWHVAMASSGYHAAARRLDRVLGWVARPRSPFVRAVSFALMLATVPLAGLVASVDPVRAQQVLPAPALPLSVALPLAVSQTPQPTPSVGPAPAPMATPSPAPSPRPDSALTTTTSRPAQQPEMPSRPDMRPYKGMSDEEFLKGLVVQDPKAPGYEAPKVLGHPSPKYNSEAMRNKIQGVVRLEVVVMPDGTVSRARIVGATWTIGLETTGGQPPTAVADAQGLDEEALNTIKRWTFTPATVNGTPVTAVVSTDMAYKIF